MKQTFEYKIEATLAKAVETYKKTEFFVASMQRAGARSVEILEEAALPDGGRRWKAKITETSRLPEFLRTSDILVVINESAFHPGEKRLEFRIVPSARSLPITLLGVIELKEEGDRTALVYDVELIIDIPLLGKRTEALGLKVVGDECRKQAALLGDWASAKDAF